MENKWRNSFLVRAALGRQVELDNQNNVVEKCVEVAYRDMLTAGRFYLLPDKQRICRESLGIMKKRGFTFSRDIIDCISELFGEDEKIYKNDTYVTRFGLAQKLINMTYKYLYVFEDYTGMNIDFSRCDCPLDSIILSKLPQSSVAWSKVNMDKYIEYQNEITKELGKKTLDDELMRLGNLAFDFLEWK